MFYSVDVIGHFGKDVLLESWDGVKEGESERQFRKSTGTSVQRGEEMSGGWRET